MRSTYSTALVLEALSHGYHYGFDIMEATGLPSGTVYPLLRRLEDQGLLTSEWNTEESRPRKFYRTSPDGDRLAVDGDTDRGAHLAPRGEVALELLLHR